jgi:hypothetical protein
LLVVGQCSLAVGTNNALTIWLQQSSNFCFQRFQLIPLARPFGLGGKVDKSPCDLSIFWQAKVNLIGIAVSNVRSRRLVRPDEAII